MPTLRDFETQEEFDQRTKDLKRKRNMVTSLTIDNIRVEDVGVVIVALQEAGLDVEINV